MFVDKMPKKGSRRRQTGLTTLEVVVSAFLVGVIVVAALNVATSSIKAQTMLSDRARALLMAQDLLTEATEMPYRDANGAPGLGPEANESTTTRADFDDVDDYDGWSSSPPTNQDGSPLPAPSNWERNVTVEYVDPDDLDGVVATNLGAKRITVQVRRAATELAEVTTVVFEPAG